MAAIRLCLITDRTALGSGRTALDAIVDLAADASAAGVNWIQIREKDLSASALVELTRRVVDAVSTGSARVAVNDRFDVALAARAHGVHLTTRSMSPAVVRSVVNGRLVVGVSTHSEAEALAAVESGADYIVCGPVFATPSKAGFGAPLGAGEVARIAGLVGMPVLAIGGVDMETAGEAMRDPVAGIAAIRLFQEAWLAGGRAALERTVSTLRSMR